jgi:Sec-independent protein translocase protein TatA
MDSFFGIGLPELLLILLLAGMVMGPHRIRFVARKLGRLTAQLQAISRQFARQLNAELDALDSDDIKGTMNDVRELQKELESLRKELGRAPRALMEDGKSAIKEGKKVVEEGPKSLQEGDSKVKSTTVPQADVAPETVTADKDKANGSAGERPLPKAIEVPDDPE